MGLVQSKQGQATASPLVITLDNPTGPASGLIVMVTGSWAAVNGTIAGVTLGGAAGNFAANVNAGTTSTAGVVAAWADLSCASGQTVVSVAFSGGTGIFQAFGTVYERDDLLASAAFDKSANDSSTAAWTSGATAALAQASEVAVGAAFLIGSSAPALTGPAAPWVNLAQLNATQGSFLDAWLSGYELTPSTAGVAYAGSATGATDGVVVVATYKVAAGPPPAPAPVFRPASRHFRSRHFRGPWRVNADIPVAPPGTVPVTDAETASAADAGESVTAALASAEVAQAAEAQGSTASLSSPETAQAAEAQSLAANLSSAETSSATEGAQPPSAALTSAETAQAAEAQGIAAALSSPETASAAESATVTQVLVASTETATASDAASAPAAQVASTETAQASEAATVALSSPETASATEAQALTASLSSPEAGTAAEAAQVRVTSTETVTASDVSTGIVQGAHDSETVTASDAQSVVASLISPETASAAEAGTLGLADQDVGHAADAGQQIAVSITSAETGTVSDTAGTVAFASADVASAAEAQASTAAFSSAESAHGTEGTEQARLSSPEAASASEGSAVAASLTSAETGTGTEAGALTAFVSAAETGLVTDSGSTGPQPVSDAEVVQVTDAGEGGTGGTAIHDTDSWHGEDSGFTYLSDGDTATASEGNERFHPSGAETVTVTDADTARWPSSAETSRASDSGFQSGPFFDSDTAHASDAGEKFFMADTETVTVNDHPAPGDTSPYIDVYAFQPLFRWTGGGFKLVSPQGRTVLVLAHLDPRAMALANELASSAAVDFIEDTEAVTASEEGNRKVLMVTMEVVPKLTVQLQVQPKLTMTSKLQAKPGI